MQASELREMTPEELQTRVRELQDQILMFRMNVVTGVVDNVRGARQAKRDIARIKTVIRERALAEEQGKNK